ncbi:MAG TPA: polysaccharide deacetylase family protein [Pyrinomonadaceae bacterium]|nr:polysaccharide deacetylase family protein [Pyrinomonadaceae bacterium]
MKKVIFTLLHAARVTRFAAWWNRRRVMILCYHGVTGRPHRSPQDPDGLHIRHDRFDAQLDHLQRLYHIISLREYLTARREGRSLPHYSVILTFDDGYRNLLTMAAPRLAARRLPATFFLITDHVRNGAGPEPAPSWSPADDEGYLSWTEIQRLEREQGIEFGSHTCSHRKLPTLSPDEAERELHDSRAAVIAHTKSETLPFAYPYGKYSVELAQRALSHGYVCALTTDAGTNDMQTDLFMLKRTLVSDFDDEAAFAARVSGLTCWLNRAQALLKSTHF